MRLPLFIFAAALAFGQADIRRTIVPGQANTDTGILGFRELNGTGGHEFQISAPLNMAATIRARWPAALPLTNGECIKSTTAGALSFGECIGAGVILQSGNTFGVPVVIGSNDAQGLNLETDNANRLLISPTGSIQLPGFVSMDSGMQVTGLVAPATRGGIEIRFDSLGGTATNGAARLDVFAPGGTSPRTLLASVKDVQIYTGSASPALRWTIDTAGDILPATPNLYSLGAPGATLKEAHLSGGVFAGASVLSSLTMAGTQSPGFDTLGSIGTNDYKYGAVYTWILKAVGAITLLPGAAPAIGDQWTATSTGGLGAWKANASSYLVTNYGALCDGATNDTTAIQAAITAAQGAGGGTITLPVGECRVTTLTVANNFVGFRGQGRSMSTLRGTTNAAVIQVDTTSGDIYAFEMKDMTLQANAGTTSYGVEVIGINDFYRSVFSNVYFAAARKALWMHNSGGGDWMSYRDNFCDVSTVTTGTCIDIENGITSPGTVIANNEFIVGPGGAAIYYHGDFGDIVISGNHSEAGGYFLNADCGGGCTYGERLIVTGNKVDNATIAPFRLNNVGNSKVYPNVSQGGVAAPVLIAGTSLGLTYDANYNLGTISTLGNDSLSLNGHASGRIRVGILDENLSNTLNGISVKDTQTSAIGIGQAMASRVGMQWNYDGTPANAYGQLYTAGNSNPIHYTASAHNFTVGNISTGTAGGYTRLGQNLSLNAVSTFAGMAINTWSATDGEGSVIDFNKSGSATPGVYTATASGETLGFFVFRGADGAAFQRSSEVLGEVDAAVSAGIVPGRLRFRTLKTDGTMAERLRIDSAGLSAFTGNVSVTGAGPSLSAGQNIANVWATGGSGFVSLGVYRTDDTNGGWLVGTSAVSVGDFGIYQNQGAGTPAQRLRINTAGNITIPGDLTVASNLTVSGTCTGCGGGGNPFDDATAIIKDNGDPTKLFRIEASGIGSGVTRVGTVPNADFTFAGINLSQTFSLIQTFSGEFKVTGSGGSAGVGADFIPIANNSLFLGSEAYLWANVHATNVHAATAFLPDSDGGADVGSTTKYIEKIWTNRIDVRTQIIAPNGNAGVSVSGTACIITAISGGVVTAATC